MATYYINRSDVPNLTTTELENRAKSFETLYCGEGKGDPRSSALEINIRGEWPDFERDGLWLRNNGGAKVIEFRRETLLIEFKNDEGEVERVEVPLVCENGGFWQIMFITVYPVDAAPIKWMNTLTVEAIQQKAKRIADFHQRLAMDTRKTPTKPGRRIEMAIYNAMQTLFEAIAQNNLDMFRDS